MTENILSALPQVQDLVFYTATEHVPRKGCAIGIVQRSACATTGITIKNDAVPGLERSYGFPRKSQQTEKVETANRARMLTVIKALTLAYETIERRLPDSIQLRQVTVFHESPEIVQLLGYRIEYRLSSLRAVKNSDDHQMIKRVITKVRPLVRSGVDVVIAVSPEGKDEAGERAKEMAREKARQACRRRRRPRCCGTAG